MKTLNEIVQAITSPSILDELAELIRAHDKTFPQEETIYHASHTGICPKCGQEYTGHPALSREDCETLICPDCGTREALDTLGIPLDEQDRIIQAIHRSFQRSRLEVN